MKAIKTMKSEIFCIIVTYNGERWIRAALKSLRDSSHPAEIVVVDNRSTDHTVDIIRSEFPEVHIIQSDRNLGFGQANNVGIQYAIENGAGYLFLMNQDVYVEPDTLSLLLDSSKNNPDFWVISPIHRNGNGKHLDANFASNISPPNGPVELLSSLVLGDDEGGLFPVQFVSAAAWFLPIKTVMLVGGFDPVFFHYGEDDNYIHRVLFHSGQVGVLTSTFIRHDRNGVGNKSVFCKGLYLRKLLLMGCDVRRMGLRWLWWFFSVPIRAGIDVAKMLFQRDFRRMADVLLSIVTFYSRLFVIYGSRKRNKATHPELHLP